MGNHLRLLGLFLLQSIAGGEGKRKMTSKGDLEATVAAAYVDRGLVTAKSVSVGGEKVEYLEAGPADAAKVVVFCHGAAFNMKTWQSVGVLDALADAGARAIAVNLPGYGASSKTIARGGKDAYLASVAAALELPKTLAVVAASMGGSYALPFVAAPGDYAIAGYATAAGSIASKDRVAAPVLGIYGSEDGRLANDRDNFGTQFADSQLVVFDDAPHPCYLRDVAAAAQFTALVVAFVTGAGATEPALKVHAAW